MKNYVQKKLASAARRLLAKRHPQIIAVTGSVGKSSTKQAIHAVLKRHGRVGVSPKNYNTEFGVPLSVLGLNMPASRWGWPWTLKLAVWRSFFPPAGYPDTLVLEMAADNPGDISYLCGIARPDIAVITSVGESHLETFGTVENIDREKGSLLASMNPGGWALLNRDDERVWAMRERTKTKVLSFGFHEAADVRALPESVMINLDPAGVGELDMKIAYRGSTVPMRLRGMLGRPAVYAALAAAAVGIARGLNLVDIAEGLSSFESEPGRLRLLTGIKRTFLLDDTYNAAPRSATAALDTLRSLPLAESARRFAILGDMLELGPVAVSGHEDVGKHAAAAGLDFLVFVGELMGEAEKAALAAGFPRDRIFHFDAPQPAARFVQERLKQGDAVLVKGSRGMRMERAVKELMAEPERARELLVAADKDW